MTKSIKTSVRDLHLAFDVGHSSLGWAVLKTAASAEPELLGCGSVIFPADDCLASQRRTFRRQRRHIRATRLRIARLKTLLAHTGSLSAEELDAVSSSSPWLLAARVLKSDGVQTLSWPELWDVIRWYAHNRGYDGNKTWSRQEEDAEAEKDDTEKVKNAFALLEKHGTETMAETWCAISGLDPLREKTSCALSGNKRLKAQNAAFPREIVVAEVRALLEAHAGKLPGMDEVLITALLKDWTSLPCPGLRLPARYHGGLLFGQLIPRFDNRIVARCPIDYERIYQETLAAEGDEKLARERAERLAKVPAASCPEFFRYRWLMQVANIQIAAKGSREPRSLSPEHRQELYRQMTSAGAMHRTELKKAVRQLTGGAADNLDQMLTHPDADKALVVDPVQRRMTDKTWAPYVGLLPEPLRKRLRGQVRRGKSVALATMRGWLDDPAAFDAVVERELDAVATKAKKDTAALTGKELLARTLRVDPVSGRAPHSRAVMREVADFVLRTNLHPAREGGPLYRSEAIRAAQLQRRIDEKTNNHLVRHRLKILDRLHRDLIEAYADDDPQRVARITIEVNRDLREMSGKTNKEIEQDLGRRLGNFKAVSEMLEKQLAGKNIPITAGLIRKARIADDLGWKCPYTGKSFDVFDLANRRVDKDHIIPRSLRVSDSLDSLVITFTEVNRMKGKRTAVQFVTECGGQTVEGLENVCVKSLTPFIKDVNALETYKGHDDDKRRKRNRKRLLLLEDYVEKEFTPRDLTQTSQLVRLGAQTLERLYADLENTPPITSLPGSVTGAVRKSWDVLGCLAAANPNVIDPATKAVRTKTEIRGITHLHHALDAAVLALAAEFLPGNARDGSAWRLLVKRRLSPEEQAEARKLFGEHVQFESHGQIRLTDLPREIKEQIRHRLAECRVVQHIPADTSGMRAELNAWRVVGPTEEGDQFWLRQRIRQPDGTRPEKKRKERPGKLVGLRPGKLHDLKAALIIGENYGLALDPEPTIIPFHKVWVRLRELREKNGGRPVRVLRNGMLIFLRTPVSSTSSGVWRICSVKASLKVDLVRPDQVGRPEKGLTVWREVSTNTLTKSGVELLESRLSGCVRASGVEELSSAAGHKITIDKKASSV